MQKKAKEKKKRDRPDRDLSIRRIDIVENFILLYFLYHVDCVLHIKLFNKILH